MAHYSFNERHSRRLGFERLESRELLAGDVQFELLKDINQLPELADSKVSQLTVVNETIFFTATTVATGNELWKSDGTVEGTVLVRETLPGTGSSAPRSLTNVDGLLYFASGNELWKSDGSAEGTVRVKQLGPTDLLNFLQGLTNIAGEVYFTANDGVHGAELWKSDGTSDGTVLVKDINLGSKGSVDFSPGSFVNLGGVLFFTADDGVHGLELWKSDGTEQGTELVRDIQEGPGFSRPSQMVVVGDQVYFYAYSGEVQSMWRSDGTSSVTIAMSSLNALFGRALTVSLVQINDTLYFGTDYFNADCGLYAFDEQSGDVRQLASFANSTVSQLIQKGDNLFYRVDGPSGYELWRTNIATSATELVNDNDSTNLLIDDILVVGDRLYFMKSDLQRGELWVSQGEAATTELLTSFLLGEDRYYFSELVGLGPTLYFNGRDALNGQGLWLSDGTVAGTVWIKDLNRGTTTSAPRYTTNVNGVLYFTALDGIHGEELWKTDGTPTGTMLVRDINPGTRGSAPRSLANINGLLYFSASDGLTGRELWRTDGSLLGTELVKDIIPGSYGGLNPRRSFGNGEDEYTSLTNVAGTIYFSVVNGFGSEQLWKSDGTSGGTVSVSSFSNGAIRKLTAVGGKLFFTASGTNRGTELWISDGTAAGTFMVRDIWPGSISSSPESLTAVSDLLFFSASSSLGRELWKSDGTEAGTVLVKDIRRGGSSINFVSYLQPTFINAGGTLYFVANDGLLGSELWKSDGTSDGTMLVKDIRSGVASSFPGGFNYHNGKLLFTANDGASGGELWRTDGTTNGTALVKDINPGLAGAYISSQILSDSAIYFRAFAGGNGAGLWKSDGTPTGTEMVLSLPNEAIGFPSSLTLVGDRLFAVATTEAFGQELWTASIATPPFTPGDYNRNGLVDLADFEVWRKDFGSAINLAADGNNDGVIDAADYTYWRTRYDAIRAPIAASPPRRSPFVQPVASATVAVSAASSTTQRDLLIASRDAAFAELGEEATVTLKRTRIAASPARRR